MMKFSSEKDGHTLLSHQSCSTRCLVLLVFHTVAANWLKEAEHSVCVPRGTLWQSEGNVQGTRRKVRPEKRSLSVNWSQIHFHIFHLLTSPLHGANSRKQDIIKHWPITRAVSKVSMYLKVFNVYKTLTINGGQVKVWHFSQAASDRTRELSQAVPGEV